MYVKLRTRMYTVCFAGSPVSVLGKRKLAVVPAEFYAPGLLLQLVVFLCILLSYLFNVGGRGLPCDLSSLMDLRRVIDFWFVQHSSFLCGRER